ncbi:MAG: acyl-CoA-binding protein [Deltaproteobacteria bacterium]|nr:acyl-CoA-binding protein [Deltaproteobacteria bacterium]
MKEAFESAVARSKTLPSQPTNIQLEMYGLYKQATVGDVTGSRPGMLDVRGRAKWDAWKKLEGVDAEEAMGAYVALVDKLSK